MTGTTEPDSEPARPSPAPVTAEERIAALDVVRGLGWASALILVVRGGHLQRLTAPLAAVGRMAFSNYILQTVCCTLMFFGYGFGRYATLSRAELMLVVLAVSAIQILWSTWWLARFRFGPLEWAWRSLTYGRRQAFRMPRLTETRR